MAKTGSFNNDIAKVYIKQILRHGNASEELQQTPLFRERENTLQQMASTLREASALADVPLILRLEKLSLGMEQDHLDNFGLPHTGKLSRQRSLDLASNRLDDALRDWDDVQNSVTYQERTARRYPHRKFRMPPKEDVFLVFIKTQVERLGRMQSYRSHAEECFFQERKQALQTAKDVYVLKQCQALGLEVPKQTQDQEKSQKSQLER